MSLIRKIRRAATLARHDRPLSPPSESDLAAQEELRRAFRELPAPDPDRETSPSGRQWAQNMQRLHELVGTEDPRGFLRWDVISRTMFVDDARYISRELGYLRAQADAAQRWLPALVENRAGHPPPYLEHPETSGNLVHHVYHVARFENFWKRPVDTIGAVLEFGGGYGGMCRLWRRLGFQGTYVILDLPPVAALQRYYLRQVEGEEGLPQGAAATVTSDPEEARRIIEPLLDLPAPCLFLSTWALSETPLSVRKEVEDLLARASGWLLAFQARFGEVDNRDYFEGLVRARSDDDSQIAEIEQLPGSAYAFLRARSQSGS